MQADHFIFAIFAIFGGAALISTFVLYIRQSTLVAYIILGLILGPFGLKMVSDPRFLNHVGQVGIIFLLFLVGLDLDPKDLLLTLRKVSLVTLGASLILIVIGFSLCILMGFNRTDSFFMGLCLIFSSTIIALKLMPTEMLYKEHLGDLMVSILLLQDLLAILALLLVQASASSNGGMIWMDLLKAALALPALVVFALLFERYLIRRLLNRFLYANEYIFIVAVGWCLGMAELGIKLGLNDGIGAFIAGVSIANNSPIAVQISQRLKPLRDFFLVLFFFAIGAMYNWRSLPEAILPASVLVVVVVVLKPWLFTWFLRQNQERRAIASQVAWRLGQGSEFALLLASLASGISPRLITEKAALTIETMALMSFILSCYYVVWRYATPLKPGSRSR
jgi:Kef-type K+ transport system membrane component KefB